MRKTSEEVKKMASAHWAYTDDMMNGAIDMIPERGHIDFDAAMALVEKAYKMAGYHFYFHAVEDMEKERKAEIES